MAKPAVQSTEVGDDLRSQRPKKELGPVFKVASGPAKWADERVGVAGLARPFLRKVFPDHWSFLLGEIALYSFIILLLTGVFLTLWFKPSMAEIEYEGTYQLLRGLHMSEAFASIAGHLVRHSRRAVAAPDAPLGRRAVPGRDAGPQPAHLLHRRVPQAA